MDAPTMIGAHAVAQDTVSLSSFVPIPGLGILAINAFVIRGTEPVLVDTGAAALREPFLTALSEAIDPADLRWIWLSHMDADHLGNLEAVLEIAPNAVILTNFLGMAKMRLQERDVSRVRLIEPGKPVAIGDRSLVPLKPPYYDAPETTGFFDTRTRVLFSADAFGALIEEPEADAAAIPIETLREGMLNWAAVDAPWLSAVDARVFGGMLEQIVRLDPSAIVSGHLPAAHGITRRLAGNLQEAVTAGRFDVPDHDTFERLIAEAATAAAA